MKIRADWYSLQVDQDENGYQFLVIENEVLRVRYGCGMRFHRGQNMHESYITEFVDKRTGEDHVQYHKNGFGWGCLDAGEWHGVINEIKIVSCGEKTVTARMTWQPIQGATAIKEVTLTRGCPYLKIHYLTWNVNIFDIGTPGGTKLGTYYLYGMDTWKRPLTYYPQIYFDRSPVDLGYENITELDEAGPLDYQGSFIMGIVNPVNGRGFGRVAPVEAIDIIKLLFKDEKIGRRGFELFPYFNRPHQPTVSYLFPIMGGVPEIEELGQRIAWLVKDGE